MRSTIASFESSQGKGKQSEVDTSHHVMIAFESDCDMSKWHIAKISHKSNAKCSTQQHGSNLKCTAKIAKGKKGTPTLTYCRRKANYSNK